jgi:integrase/recombinase XerD
MTKAMTMQRRKGRGPKPSLCVPIEEWPAADRYAWEASMIKSGPFDDGGLAADWPAARIRNVKKGYGRFLTFLAGRGELDPSAKPGERATRARVSAYLAELFLRNSGFTIPTRLQELGDGLRAMAPEANWRWILRGAGRLRSSTVPARDKRLAIRPIEELIVLGFDLMSAALSKSAGPPLKRALLYRDGLILAFLGFHPIRLRNLAGLRIGTQLIVHSGGFWLKLAPEETKNGRAYECAIADRLVPRFERYLHHERRLLREHAGLGTDALWISLEGGGLTDGAIEKRVRKRTSGDARPPVSPHLFRSCAATTVAVHAPKDIHIVPALLNHATPTTAEEFYNLAGSLEASRAYNAAVDEVLDALDKQIARTRDDGPLGRSADGTRQDVEQREE